MNFAVVTTCQYPDRKPIHYLDESCQKQGIELLPHGIGDSFGGWGRMFVQAAIPHMKELRDKGYSHVLYLDGVDSVIISSLKEIKHKWLSLYAPLCLMSADSDAPSGYGDKFTDRGTWRYLNAGQFMGEINFIISWLEYLSDKHLATEGNSQNWFLKEWPMKGFALDHDCKIFQVIDGSPFVQPYKGRVRNWETMQDPSILHFRGGYCDPVTGRDERIEKLWRQIYDPVA